MPAQRFRRVADDALEQWKSTRRRILDEGAHPGAVHAWRIATRRLLALEALLGPHRTAGSASALHALVQPAFHTAGRLRDGEVLIQLLRELPSDVPAARRLAQRPRQRRDRRMRKLKRRLQALPPRDIERVISGWFATADEPAMARRAASRLRTRRQLLSKSTWRTTPAALHRQRIRVKEARYQAEFCADAGLPVPPAWRATRLATLQRQAGAITDLDMALHECRRVARHHPEWRDRITAVRTPLQHQRAKAALRLTKSLR